MKEIKTPIGQCDCFASATPCIDPTLQPFAIEQFLVAQ
jgi:hypothetical protein